MVLVVGSERLYSDLSRKYANRTGDEAISVIKLDKSGGCVDRDENYMKELRRLQIRSYFFGSGDNFLSPSTYWEDYGALHVFKVVPGTSTKHDASILTLQPSPKPTRHSSRATAVMTMTMSLEWLQPYTRR